MYTKLLTLFALIAVQMLGNTFSVLAYVSTPRIDYPKEGQVLQGVVLLSGSTDVNGFQSAEFSFSYSGSEADEENWFLIQSSYEPVVDSTLAVWDTTTIADGNYDLRVKVVLADGRERETIVANLRVRNYSPVETGTEKANVENLTQPLPEIAETEPGGHGLKITPTDIPSNPLQLTTQDVRRNVVRGAAASIGALSLIGFYFVIRRRLR